MELTTFALVMILVNILCFAFIFFLEQHIERSRLKNKARRKNHTIDKIEKKRIGKDKYITAQGNVFVIKKKNTPKINDDAAFLQKERDRAIEKP